MLQISLLWVDAGTALRARAVGAEVTLRVGEILSTPYRHYRTIEERIESKLVELGDAATPGDRLQIRAEQYRIGDRAPVAGYDCTFSPAKSVSALWALAPADQRAVIEMSHDRAVDAAFGWLEDRALHTRAGRDGVRHLDADGFVVAGFGIARTAMAIRSCTPTARWQTGSGRRPRAGGGPSTDRACTGNGPVLTRCT